MKVVREILRTALASFRVRQAESALQPAPGVVPHGRNRPGSAVGERVRSSGECNPDGTSNGRMEQVTAGWKQVNGTLSGAGCESRSAFHTGARSAGYKIDRVRVRVRTDKPDGSDRREEIHLPIPAAGFLRSQDPMRVRTEPTPSRSGLRTSLSCTWTRRISRSRSRRWVPAWTASEAREPCWALLGSLTH